jgi:2-methylcitrate dehydratase PrpD
MANDNQDGGGANAFSADRRRALQGIGAMALAGIPGLAQTVHTSSPQDVNIPGGEKTYADYPVSDVMRRLSAYMAQARNVALPAAVLERTKWAVLDTLAATVSGSQLPAGRAALAYVRANGGKPVSTVIAANGLCDPVSTAMINGTMGHADETDDHVTGPWHPGINTVPAALALGEQFRISGQHFLRAVALGYDVGTRVMLASGVKLNFKVPTNSMGGVFGATASAACAAGLNEEQCRWALAYGAQQCSGIDDFRRDLRHIEKGFMNGGMGARSGVTSALLVLAGFDGVNDILGGPASFFTAYEATAKPELLIDGLGQTFYVTKANFKRWPTGGPVQVMLDSLQALLKRRPIDPSQVREIVVWFSDPGVTNNGGPPDINVQHAAALMLTDKRLTFASIHDYARLKDPAIVRLRSMTKVVQQTWTASVPGSADTPLFEITLADGTKIRQNYIASGYAGAPDTPYTREWVAGKAQSLMSPVLGDRRAAQLVARVLTLDEAKTVLDLRPLMQADETNGAPRLSNWPMPSALP